MRTYQPDPRLSYVLIRLGTLGFSLASVSGSRSLVKLSVVPKQLDVEIFTLKGETECELDAVVVRDDLHEERAERWLPVTKAWLENCVKNHPACVAKQAVLPTRVIDVGT
jgi:hypothetical protein